MLRSSSLPLAPSAGHPVCASGWLACSCKFAWTLLRLLRRGRSRSSNDKNLGYVVNEPEGPRVLGGVGPPRYCQQLGGRKDYRDGGGLCSPGRWKPEARSLASGPSWDWLREKTLDLVLKELGATDVRELEREAFRMAAGGEHGCSLAKNEKLQSQLRQLWKDWLEAQDLGEEGLPHQAEGQPLYLRLLRGLLEAAGDPDREFLRRAEEGLPLGILEQLPRTPHVFEEQLKWPLENAPWEASLALRRRAPGLR